MGKLYPESVINDVLDRSNIVDVVATYLPLKRVGRNFKACCPFHPEKTASFIVSADKQIYHCFGCGVGGNALSFIMQYEKLNFREALESLAQRSGIPLPEPERSEYQKSSDDNKKNLYDLYEKASQFYHNNLMKSPKAQAARSYLQKRGISKEMAELCHLGYSLSEWDSLLNYLKSKKANLSSIERSGLVVSKDEGGYYDRFRNRVLFPIVDIKDRVIGFGARVLDDSLPKYINSPETPIYSKGKNLFGLNWSRDYIRKEDCAIVVEGYLDMLVPFISGAKNIVASLGTALTPDQIRLLKRFTNNVIMLYDGDLAGEMATLRALDILIKEDMSVRIATLPSGDDPDTFIRKAGLQGFLERINKAMPIFDYKFQLLLTRHHGSTTEEKQKIIREILPTVKKFKDMTTRSASIKTIAEALRLDEKALWDDFSLLGEEPYTEDDSDAQGSFESKAIQHYKLKEIPITERMLVKLMLDEIHLVDQLRLLIQPEDFVEEKLRTIVKFIFDFFSQGKTCKPNVLMNYLGDDEAINIISELATLDIHACPDKEKLITDCVKRLKRDKIVYECQELYRKIQVVQSEGNQESLDKLIFEYNALIKQRSQFYGEVGS